MDFYVKALLEAIAAVRDITGADDVNLHGACSGAMTMSALLGHLAAKQEPLVNAATLMVAVLGHSPDSQLGLFSIPETIAAAKQSSAAKGVLEGQEMGRVFAWMRPNDLVWNYWVNNYLMGNHPRYSISCTGTTTRRGLRPSSTRNFWIFLSIACSTSPAP